MRRDAYAKKEGDRASDPNVPGAGEIKARILDMLGMTTHLSFASPNMASQSQSMMSKNKGQAVNRSERWQNVGHRKVGASGMQRSSRSDGHSVCR